MVTRAAAAGLLLVLLTVAGAGAAARAQDKGGADGKVDRCEAAVTKLRGLEFPREVKVGSYSKAEFLKYVEDQLDKELPTEKSAKQERALAKFGLVPKGFDLRGAYVELLTSAVAAFYDPESKELKVVRGGGSSFLETKLLKMLGIDLDAMVLVHELTHAAQDQAFDLSTLPLDDPTNDDLGLALRGVVEGDASAVGWKYALGDRFDRVIGSIDSAYKSGQIPGKAGELPAYLRLTLTFPYGYGTDFVVQYLRGPGPDGFRKASDLFKKLPLSSEQILHPEKYLAGDDPPILVTLPDLAGLFGAPWKETLNNVHGEYGIRILLGQFKGEGLSPADVKTASEGWGGDRYSVLEDGSGQTMYVWYTAWDTEQDAREFFSAYRRALERKTKSSAGPEPDAGPLAWKTPEGLVSLERRGKDVLVFDGATEKMLEKADEIWKGARKSEMTSVERKKKDEKKKDY